MSLRALLVPMFVLLAGGACGGAHESAPPPVSNETTAASAAPELSPCERRDQLADQTRSCPGARQWHARSQALAAAYEAGIMGPSADPEAACRADLDRLETVAEGCGSEP